MGEYHNVLPLINFILQIYVIYQSNYTKNTHTTLHLNNPPIPVPSIH